MNQRPLTTVRFTPKDNETTTPKDGETKTTTPIALKNYKKRCEEDNKGLKDNRRLILCQIDERDKSKKKIYSPP